MAASFQTWTVLKHKPIEKVAPGLWTVNGTMPDAKVTRVMSIARLADGDLVIHNAIALDEPEMAEIEAWGRPAWLLVPNGFHRQDAKIFKDRYPALRVLCPRNATNKVRVAVAVDGSYDDFPKNPAVRLEHLAGCKESEGAMIASAPESTTVVLNDTLMNHPKLGGVMGFMMSPTGQPAVPRVMRWMVVKDKRALGSHLEALAATPNLQRVVVAHGAAVTDEPVRALRQAAKVLTS